jgi:hypothetical protein
LGAARIGRWLVNGVGSLHFIFQLSEICLVEYLTQFQRVA